MNIGILGAAFNPPHTGHLMIAQQALELVPFDRVWFLPTFRHTFAKQTVEPNHRINMTKLLIQNYPQFELSSLEIDHQLDGNTINLIPILRAQFPRDRFMFIIGSDNLSTFHKWGRWQTLLKQMPFLVFPRAGYPMSPTYEGMNSLTHKLLTITNISSTTIRERIKIGLSVNLFVPDSISKYIAGHHLY